MIINPLTKSQLLSAMKPGDQVIWYCEESATAKIQRQWAAAAQTNGVQISQRKAVVSVTACDQLPAAVLIIELLF